MFFRKFNVALKYIVTVCASIEPLDLSTSCFKGAGCNDADFKTLMAASLTLNGSCVTVPCSFTVDNTYKDKIPPECGKLWFKKDTKVLISSTTFRGDLTAYDCPTTFNNVHEDNGQYYFRIDCDGRDGFRYNFDKTPVTIQIKGKCNVCPSETNISHKSYWSYCGSNDAECW